MKVVFSLFFCIFYTVILYGQVRNSDTVGLESKEYYLSRLDTVKVDSVKAEYLQSLGENYVWLKPDSALILAQQSFNLSKKIKFITGEADALFTMGKAYQFKGDYPKSLELFLQSLKINQSLKRDIWIASNFLLIGEVYGYQGDYEQSLGYSFKARDIAEQNNYYNVTARAFLNIGSAYEKINLLDSAKLFTQKSYNLTMEQKVPRITGRLYSTLGNIYTKKEDYTKALSYYRQSIPLLDSLGLALFISESNLGIAKIFEKTNHVDLSLYYAKESLAIAQRAGFTRQIFDASVFLTSYYKKNNNVDSAFYYQEITLSARDSLFSQEKIMEFQNISFSQQMNEQKILEAQEQFKSQVKIYILIAGLGILLLIAAILFRNNRHKEKANHLLHQQKNEINLQRTALEKSFEELKSAQAQLVQSEKMASLGELTAGIAHEIQNPLNFVNNFSEVSAEMLDELHEAITKGDNEEVKLITSDIKLNLEKIIHHGKRADAIVKAMLLHSRSNSGQKEPTDINSLTDEYLRLSYHGLRGKDKTFNATLQTDFDESIGKLNIIQQDIGRVILNIITNAFYSVTEKKKMYPEGFEPTVSVTTKKNGGKAEIHIKDNGLGIPQKVLEKIYQPFFTTKPTGQGTGLGLSLSYDIIKAHSGTIKVETKEGEYAEFIITLPL